VARILFRQSVQEDVNIIAGSMRVADIAELKAGGSDPLSALQLGLDSSDVCVTVTTLDGEPFAMYGVAPGCVLTGMGRPWLLGTDTSLKYKREFLTATYSVINSMLSMYPRLENYVHVDNRISVRWLKWMGFNMDDPFVSPVSGEKFMRFWMRINDNV